MNFEKKIYRGIIVMLIYLMKAVILQPLVKGVGI